MPFDISQFNLSSVWAPLDDPGSRLFHVNLAASLLLLAGFVIVKSCGEGRRFSEAMKEVVGPNGCLRRSLLRKRYWWNRSTHADYKIYLLNTALKVLLFIPLLDFGYRFSQLTVKSLVALRGDFIGLSATTPWLLVMTIASFVFDDFLRFIHHWLMHRVSWLWPFHEVHHSARILTPMTLYRTHPVEAAMATLRNSLSLGISTGIFIFLFESQFTLITFFGVNLFGIVFNFLGANLRHSHIPISFGRAERVFISPLQHQIHHSRATDDYDRNYGVSLAVWDLMFGSHRSSAELRGRKLRFGVDGPFESRVGRILIRPFLKKVSVDSQDRLKEHDQLPIAIRHGTFAEIQKTSRFQVET